MLLLKNGAKVNLKEQTWQNALEAARQVGHHDVIALIENAQETKPLLTMLERKLQKNNGKAKNNMALDLLPADLIREVKTRLTCPKYTSK